MKATYLTITNLAKLIILVAFCATFSPSIAFGEITTAAYWRGGENDDPAPSGSYGVSNPTTRDSTPNSLDLEAHNAGVPGPFYIYPGATKDSSVTLSFDPTGKNAFSREAIATLDKTNWGIQCYTNSSIEGSQLVSNGLGGNGLLILNGCYSGMMDGRVLQGSVRASGGEQWHNVALVNDSGELQLYVDGVLNASSQEGEANEITGLFTLGAAYDGTEYVNFTDGNLDEIRVFTFKPGQFKDSDLGNYVLKKR